MVLYNIGSVVADVTSFVGAANVPVGISGTNMNNLVIQSINYLNTYTADGIGTVDIDEKYQPSVIDLTSSKVLYAIDANQGGLSSVSLGELSVSDSGQGGNSDLANQLRTDAINRMKELGRSLRFKRVIGG